MDKKHGYSIFVDYAGVHILIIRKTGKIRVSIKNVRDGLGIRNMSDLVFKEINGRYETNNPTNM